MRGGNLLLRNRERSNAPASALRASEYRPGQIIWLNGRAAVFCYSGTPGNGVVRYHDEKTARVVPLYKIATAAPHEQP